MLISLALFFAVAGQAVAAERITSFLSDVTIGADSALTVTETIAIVSEGDEIKRGINRDFPTRYRDSKGLSYVVGFEVLGVKRDGRDEPYTLMSIANGERIRIGSADVFLNNGQHIYEITYRTTRQLGYFGDYDELYWNVTGNSWTFPIERAETIIRLPPGATIRQHAEYTGRQGERGSNAEVLQSTGDRYRARTTRTLAPDEGFTVAVGWPKGFVTAPTEIDKAKDAIRDNLGFFAVAAGVLLAFVYYLFAWFRVGRDPPKGVIIPLFTPPAGLGPAGMRYVWKQGFDDKSFAASLVGLAVKGRLKIIEKDGGFSIQRKDDQSQPLMQAEAALYRAIPRGTTELEQSNHSAVRAMKSAIEDTLEKEHEGVTFVRNLKWFWGGIAISVIALLAGAALLPGDDAFVGLFISAWSTFWWGILLVISWSLVKGIFETRGVFAKIKSFFALGFLVPFFLAGGGVPAAVFFSAQSPALYGFAAGAVALVAMGFVFHWLLRAPTIMGRKRLDQVEGFRMYLKTAEEERLKVLHPPEKTPELFERYLPFALALDCENEWNAKFAAVLAAAAAAGAAASPIWYSGDNWNPTRMDDFTGSLGKSLSSATSSSSVAPGSNSGSFGGGSSGGGGGGGGGSGW
ncbi:DUF2207 domain-containing protein [Nordella sp. HKS 07]|uniref:DUF2207 domain-containing protein n=1 Tax=Nordella sp. HKS 07 TaxID=2712222 RepID=UPI0013E0EC5A|nr:DUF2207 domain-containing protein [Nordella sp. HKS 07]QIG50338.1 DUF2207 domain-containing protein [Nordella sp. HKS 07]